MHQSPRLDGKYNNLAAAAAHLVHEGDSAQVGAHALAEQLEQRPQVQVPSRQEVHLPQQMTVMLSSSKVLMCPLQGRRDVMPSTTLCISA